MHSDNASGSSAAALAVIRPTTPANAVRTFYVAINRRNYALAFKLVAPNPRAAWSAFSQGYRTTKHVTIDRLVDPGYRIREPGATFACVGVRYTATFALGLPQTFAGWYLTFRRTSDFWRIFIPSSEVVPGDRLVVPDQDVCAGAIPTQYLPAGTNTLLAAADFISPQTGWVVVSTSQAYVANGGCDQGMGSGCNTATLTVLKTVDGGGHWTRQLRFTAAPYGGAAGLPDILYFHFLNRRDGFLSVPTDNGHVQSGVLYRTRNGGATWHRLSLPGAPVGAFGGPSFSFIDSQHGWLLANVGAAMGQSTATIYATGNGGTTWHEVSHTDFRHPNQGPGIGGDKASIVFRSRAVGWLTAVTAIAPLISVTFDGGVTWYHQYLAPVVPHSPRVTYQSIPGVPQCFDAGACVFPILAAIDHLKQRSAAPLPYRLYVYASHNGGASWPTLKRLPGWQRFNLSALTWQFLDSRDWWVTDAGHIWISGSGGRSWTRRVEHLPAGFGIVGLDFVDATTGWALATVPGPGGDFALRSALFKTVDGGVAWKPVTVGA